MPTKRKHGGGMPSKYKLEYDKQVYQLALLGLTDEQMGAVFGVDKKTVGNWAREHPSFGEARRSGKELADGQVAHGLFQRAVGYSHPDTYVSVIKDNVVMTPIVKHYPPETEAIKTWLHNRQPNLWHTRQPRGETPDETEDERAKRMYDLLKKMRSTVNDDSDS